MLSSETFADTVELLRRAKSGEEECLTRVLERYRARLLERVRWMMGAEARRVAESGDFLHSVFVKILEHFDHFEPRDDRSFLRWATQIARNGIRDDVCRRREKLLETLASEGGIGAPTASGPETPDQAAARAEQLANLVDALTELDADQRLVVELRHFEHLPFAEIGSRMGRSANAAQLLHTRVLLQLGRSLADGRSG